MRILFCLMLSAFTAPAVAGITVHLKDLSTVQARQVKLSDVAMVQDSENPAVTKSLNNLVVAVMTHYDQPLRIEAEQMRRLILRQQPGFADKLTMAGADSVAVVLPSTEISIEDVEASVKAFLHSELDQLVSRLEVKDVKVDQPSLRVPQANVELRPRYVSQIKLDTQIKLAVDAFVGKVRLASIPVTANLNIVIPVHRVTRDVAPGQSLGESDYEVVEQAIDYPTRMAALINSQFELRSVRTKRKLVAGQLLQHQDLERAPHVLRNQEVLAELNANGISIQKPVIAQVDGYVGQTIRVADARTATVYRARVVSTGHVEVE